MSFIFRCLKWSGKDWKAPLKVKRDTVQASVPNGSHVFFQGRENRSPKPPGARLQGKHSAGNGTATTEWFQYYRSSLLMRRHTWQRQLLQSCHVNDEIDARGGRESATRCPKSHSSFSVYTSADFHFYIYIYIFFLVSMIYGGKEKHNSLEAFFVDFRFLGSGRWCKWSVMWSVLCL